MSCLTFIAVVVISYIIDFIIVAACYGLTAWAFNIEFSWPINAALSLILMFVLLLFKDLK